MIHTVALKCFVLQLVLNAGGFRTKDLTALIKKKKSA